MSLYTDKDYGKSFRFRDGVQRIQAEGSIEEAE